MAENENDQERMRRWFREAQERGGPMMSSPWYVENYIHVGGKMSAPTPAASSKDWSKIETYWPHLAKQGGAVAPRKGV